MDEEHGHTGIPGSGRSGCVSVVFARMFARVHSATGCMSVSTWDWRKDAADGSAT